jgi:CheY-like chemotaxis protein
MPDQSLRFIVIDDNKLDCFIADKIIRNKGLFEQVFTFTEALNALAFIESTYPDASCFKKTIIILDIQMPIMNGFDFVDAFEKLDENIQQAFAIFMISSTVNETDRNRVKNYKSINKLYSKPFSKELLSEMLEHIKY